MHLSIESEHRRPCSLWPTRGLLWSPSVPHLAGPYSLYRSQDRALSVGQSRPPYAHLTPTLQAERYVKQPRLGPRALYWEVNEGPAADLRPGKHFLLNPPTRYNPINNPNINHNDNASVKIVRGLFFLLPVWLSSCLSAVRLVFCLSVCPSVCMSVSPQPSATAP